MRDNPDGGIDRREALLDGAIAAAAACAGTLVAWPAVRSLTPPSGGVARRGVVGKRDDFAPGTASVRALDDRAVMVVAAQDGTLRAFDARCTHLGCTVGFDRAAREIACGCHGGRFALDGSVLAGPPPSPLRALQVTLVGDDVLVEDV